MSYRRQPQRWTEPDFRLDIVTGPDEKADTEIHWFTVDSIHAAFATARALLRTAAGPEDRYGELWMRVGREADHLSTLHLDATISDPEPAATACDSDRPGSVRAGLERAMADHPPNMGTWSCITCSEPWPCPSARRDIHANTTSVQRAELAALVSVAALAQPQLSPAAAWHRFLAWIAA